MTVFLYTIAILLILSIISKVYWVANGEFPKREAKYEIWDIFINIMLVFWAINLLIL